MPPRTPRYGYLEQEKAYQRVVAPFDGVITQRNIDNGSLVQSESTFMYTLMHPDVIRTQVFIPQDEAFGLGPGVDAVIRVPEIRTEPFRQGDAHRNRVAARQPHAADGDRCAQSGLGAPPRNYCTVELFIPRKTPSMIIQPTPSCSIAMVYM